MPDATMIDWIMRGGLLIGTLIAIWGGKEGWYIWKGSHDKEVEALKSGYENRITELRTAHESAVQMLEKSQEEFREDRDYWREHAVSAMTAAQKAVQIADKATN